MFPALAAAAIEVAAAAVVAALAGKLEEAVDVPAEERLDNREPVSTGGGDLSGDGAADDVWL